MSDCLIKSTKLKKIKVKKLKKKVVLKIKKTKESTSLFSIQH